MSGVVTSASLLGAVAGSVAAFLLKDRVGRKAELLFAASAYGTFSISRTKTFNDFTSTHGRTAHSPNPLWGHDLRQELHFDLIELA
jgi:gas vesicle protein